MVVLVLRADIKDYINNASAYVTDLIDTTFQYTQPPSDITSLAKNNTPIQPEARLNPYDRLITSKNKNISQNSIIDLDKIAQENAALEMERIKIIAAENFARFKAELEVIEQQEQKQKQKQNSAPNINVNAAPTKTTKNTQNTQNTQNTRSTVTIAGIQTVSNKNVSKKVTPKQAAIPQAIQTTRLEPEVPAKSASVTATVATLNTELHQRTLKSFSLKPAIETNRASLEEKLFEDDTVVIIVNSKNNQSITEEDIKNLYTDKITSWNDGKKIIVYNLPVNSRTREIFSYKLLHKSPSQAATAASNRVITNVIRNSTETKTARLVVSTVSKNPTAIGYTTYKNVKGKNNLRIIMAVE